MLGSRWGNQHELPRAPVEFADEVEMYARLSGRHATLHFVPTSLPRGGAVHGFWMIRFTLREHDKRLEAYQAGKKGEDGQPIFKEPPTDDTWLIDKQGKPLRLEDLGVSGLRTFLEQGSLTSGRGEYASLEDQLRKVREHNKHVAEKTRADAKENSRKEQMDFRRQRLGIPLVRGHTFDAEGEPSLTGTTTPTKERKV